MNEDTVSLAEGIISPSFARHGRDGLRQRQLLIRDVFSRRALPETGFDDLTIDLLLADLAAMDSNNFPGILCAGEREGRIYSAVVRRRHYALSHGIGRSGDILGEQPKAAGSTLMAKMANRFALEALRLAGARQTRQAVIVPVATGMALTLLFLALKASSRPNGRFVIVPRIDQKTCLKCIVAAGLTPVVVENRLVGDQVVCDPAAVQKMIEQLSDTSREGPASQRFGCIVCVMAVTSCFAPRTPDDVVGIARMCKSMDIPFVVNNAYGVQLHQIMSTLDRAAAVGRVDAFVQSTDKNFMVPVGGAVVATHCSDGDGSRNLVAAMAKMYPGRGSSDPSLDVFITLLSMGRSGWQQLLCQRDRCFELLRQRLTQVAAEVGERVLETPDNPISLAMTVTVPPSLLEEAEAGAGAGAGAGAAGSVKAITRLGSMLYQQHVSGARVNHPQLPSSSVAGLDFAGYGTHVDGYPTPYLNVAAAIGITAEEVEALCAKISKIYRTWRRKLAQPQPQPSGIGDASSG